MDYELPEPANTEIEAISWSRFQELKLCARRVQFSLDTSTRRYNENEYSLLGTLAHEFREKVGTAGLIDAEQSRSLWEVIEQELLDRIARQSDTGATPPTSSDWYNYAVTKARSIKIASERDDENRTEGNASSFARMFEKRLESDHQPVLAIVDLLIISDTWALIKDLKTGIPKESHSDQLLFYSAVFNDVYGRWPNKLVVEYLGLNEIVVESDESSAKSMLQEAINRRDLFNLRSSRGKKQFATPKLETCYHCTYRPICRAYQNSELVRSSDYGVSGVFEIDEIGKPGESYRVTSKISDVGPGEYLLLLPAGSTLELTPGSFVAINGLTRSHLTRTLRMEWNASIWQLSNEVVSG